VRLSLRQSTYRLRVEINSSIKQHVWKKGNELNPAAAPEPLPAMAVAPTIESS